MEFLWGLVAVGWYGTNMNNEVASALRRYAAPVANPDKPFCHR